MDVRGSDAGDAANADVVEDVGWRFPERGECASGSFGVAEARGSLPDRIDEASGLVTSARNDRLLWFHNDSGDDANLYAVTASDGVLRATLALDGVTAVDAEDLAIAACPDRSGPCLWLGDFGDNNALRPSVAVYATPEPDVSGVATGAMITSQRVWRYEVTYPDGPMNAEALVVAADASWFGIFEKTAGQARVARHPGPLDEETPAARELDIVGQYDLPAVITGADLHPDGRSLLLRTYGSVYFVNLGQRGLEALGMTTPLPVSAASEPQGETVAWDGTGSGFWTASEDADGGDPEPIYHYDCAE